MSLTSIIERDKELREKIKATFLRPKLEKNKPLVVEPLTKRYSLVGTAFDYLFRFFLERINDVQNDSKIWVSEQAIELLMPDQEVYEVGSEIINNVKELKKEFIETGNLSQ